MNDDFFFYICFISKNFYFVSLSRKNKNNVWLDWAFESLREMVKKRNQMGTMTHYLIDLIFVCISVLSVLRSEQRSSIAIPSWHLILAGATEISQVVVRSLTLTLDTINTHPMNVQQSVIIICFRILWQT